MLYLSAKKKMLFKTGDLSYSLREFSLLRKHVQEHCPGHNFPTIFQSEELLCLCMLVALLKKFDFRNLVFHFFRNFLLVTHDLIKHVTLADMWFVRWNHTITEQRIISLYSLIETQWGNVLPSLVCSYLLLMLKSSLNNNQLIPGNFCMVMNKLSNEPRTISRRGGRWKPASVLCHFSASACGPHGAGLSSRFILYCTFRETKSLPDAVLCW